MRMMGTKSRLQELKKRVQAVVDSTAGHVSFMLEDKDGIGLKMDADVQKKAASLIKIPILMAAFKQVQTGKLKLTDRFSIDEKSRVAGAGVLQFIDCKTSFSFSDLLTLMIIVSDNTATNKVIEIIGMESVDDFCVGQGLSRTKLERKMMDFRSAEAGFENSTSVHDMVTCLKLLDEDKSVLFTNENKRLMLDILHGQQLLDKLPFYMDLESVKVANKTGELPGVEHDCGIVSLGETNLFIAVMADGLYENSEGKRAIQQIGRIVEDYLRGSCST